MSEPENDFRFRLRGKKAKQTFKESQIFRDLKNHTQTHQINVMPYPHKHTRVTIFY